MLQPQGLRGITPSIAQSSVLRNLNFLFSFLRWHGYTLLLFTWTDYKTIFFPITTFACSVGPLHSTSNLLKGWFWIWVHQLLCNVSNQARAKTEDAINRPWRPLPAGRVSEYDAIALRWTLTFVCVLLSAAFGSDLVATTMGLIITTYMYDERGWSNHYITKNLCNIGGYVTLEIGAAKIIGYTQSLDYTSTIAVALSGMLIFTTIQTQDFPDVEGDASSGRITFPIYAPELSRVLTLVALGAWSIFLSWFWELGIVPRVLFIILGIYTGFRCYKWRTVESDELTYRIFNIWLVAAHMLPLNMRLQQQVLLVR